MNMASFPTQTVFQATDWANQCMTYLPDGPAWNKNPSSNMYQAILALMGTFVDHQTSAANLLPDAFPATTVDLLPEWQTALGLPDSCSPTVQTLAQAQQQVLARFAGVLGQSVPFLIQYAAMFGFTITITEFAVFSCNSNCNAPLANSANYVQINLPNVQLSFFEVGTGEMGDPLVSTAPFDLLECELDRVMPATAVPFFNVT
jgi:uncharacterized protein YmfQ (DUF2313 family)